MENETTSIEAWESFPSTTIKCVTGCGSLFVTVGEKEGRITFLSARLGKGGGCANAMCSTLTEVVAEALRGKVPIENLVKIMRGVGCSSRTEKLGSCVDAIGGVLENWAKKATRQKINEP